MSERGNGRNYAAFRSTNGRTATHAVTRQMEVSGGYIPGSDSQKLSEWTAWDRVNPDGEGVVPEEKPFQRPDRGKFIQWIRVYRGRDSGKAVATFHLWWKDRQPDRMGLALSRKGLPPNPFDRPDGARMFDWRQRELLDPSTVVDQLTPDTERLTLDGENARRAEAGLPPCTDGEWDRMVRFREMQLFAGTGWFSAMKRDGARPTIEVYPIPSRDGDHRWKFPEDNGASFKVRGSLLAQALFTLRMSGQQRVSVYTLRETVSRIQQG